MEKNKAAQINALHPVRIKSYVARNSRMTASQKRAFSELLPIFALSETKPGFGNQTAPLYLEIGFGSGQSLAAAARLYSQCNFIGIETHKPGIGALLLALEEQRLFNVRLLQGDAFDLLQNHFADGALDGIQIFFPDPWPKRRHHARRLINPAFNEIVASKLKINASLHIATDWEDYANHVIKVMRASSKNFLDESDGERSWLRPTVTKFEARALREGRKIWDLKYRRIK